MRTLLCVHQISFGHGGNEEGQQDAFFSIPLRATTVADASKASHDLRHARRRRASDRDDL
jgi:hypothetical protein